MAITPRSIIGLILIFVICYFSFQIIEQAKTRQAIVIENAEVKNIRYGLLSVHSWKRQIAEIMTTKVQEFELTTENRRELKTSIQEAMHKLLNELERILNEKKNEGKWWEVAIKAFVQDFIQTFTFSIDDLRSRVPEFTEIILDELDNYETREKLRVFIQKKVDDLLYSTIGAEDLSNIEAIAAKYDCSGIKDCSVLLQSELEQIDAGLNKKSLIIIGISTIIFLLILLGNKEVQSLEYAVLVLVCGILLYVGVTTPMIDIDARIENFSFLLMGEQLEFKDQILFFQSKSIFEVVSILVSTGEYQSIIVGGLIFLFSIIFPISKLISSLAIINYPELYKNRIVNFLALKSGKWSMADVVVVAIFMAYIGFKGVIENQLKQLEGIGDKVEILTTDNSNFGIGFMLFLAFCIGGLVLASRIEKQIKV